MTIEQIKEQCREAIKVEEAADPHCLRGGFSPNAAKALLATIDSLRSLACFSREAQDALNKICTNWTL